MTPKVAHNFAKDPACAEVRSNLTALEAEYRLYRKASDRFHAIAEIRLGAMRDALTRYEDSKDSSSRKAAHVPQTNHKPLSKREIQILKLIAEGHGTKQAAEAMGVAFKTAVGHRSNLMIKLGLHDSVSLARYAIRMGLIDP